MNGLDLNSHWKTVVSTIQDGLMIVDRTGTIRFVNPALTKMTGYAPKEMIGMPCSSLNCDVCEIARAPGRGSWCVLFQEGAIPPHRCTLRRKDGTMVPVLKNAALLRDAEGAVIGAVETLTDLTELKRRDLQIQSFTRELADQKGFQGILGVSVRMQKVFDLLANAASSDAPVLILGESGTGKELAARAIHRLGPRRDKPFIKVNCAALNEALLESELFGHVRGAFTGAYRDREGRFEAAHGGDIFLDEVGDLSFSTQVKLLRVLEEKTIEKVGDQRSIRVDVRIISATNREVAQLAAEGKIRQDFFYRINVIPIRLPPLRKRIEDIPILAEHFLERLRKKSRKPVQGISSTALECLMDYSWPGNVRELKSAFEYAFISCHETLIQPEHLPSEISAGKKKASPPATPKRGTRNDQKRQRLLEALQAADGNQSEAARILGVSRVTVWNRIKKYGIDLEKKVSG
ncbi:PAS modulated sigma54 specific transcriptional regulator, Fis family [uncultured Desulfatiglans sp.]|nr:PAS modulated sigma54 specific transcriptional regulator, Fis family [uncultured Desulfatiglans sp.]